MAHILVVGSLNMDLVIHIPAIQPQLTTPLSARWQSPWAKAAC